MRDEHAHVINGVNGRMYPIHEPQEIRGNMVYRAQKWVSESRTVKGYGTNGRMSVEIRFDDECANGHMSFAITATVYTDESRRRRDCAAGGCLHEGIAAVFPKLAPLIKWHLMSTDGPMHYLANTLYHAGDRDCNGLRAGEVRQFKNGKTGQLAWILEATEKLPQYVDSDTQPTETATMRYVPWNRVGEGKTRDFAAARSCAVWPDATDEQLSLPKEDLQTLLAARLPGLIAEFRADMERIGMLWEPATQEVQPC